MPPFSFIFTSQMKPMSEENVCPACSSKKVRFALKVNEYDLFNCETCRFQFLWPIPDDATLAKLYDDHQYHDEERYDSTTISPRVERIWKKRLKTLHQDLGVKPGSLIDVGCATGIFLKNAKDESWEVLGLEASPQAAEQAQILLGKEYVEIADFMHFSSAKPLNLITMWALIEHVRDPKSYLLKAQSLLEKDGWIALATPNMRSFSAKIKGAKWRYYIPPFHITYGSPASLTRLLESSGFEVMKIVTHFRPIAFFSKGSKALKLYEKNIVFRLATTLILAPLRLFAERFHWGETIEVYAKKK